MQNFVIEWMVEFIGQLLFSHKCWWITCLVLPAVALIILCCYHRV